MGGELLVPLKGAKRPIGPKVTSDLAIYVDAQHLEAQLLDLEVALSPLSIAGWLEMYMAPWLQARAERRFMNEGDDATGAWAPLRPATQAIRTARGYGASHPINVRTHELENYIAGSDQGEVAAVGIGARLWYPQRQVSGGSNELRQKVLTAQIGRNGDPRTVPRPVLAVSELDVTYAVTSLSAYIAGGWNSDSPW